MKTKILLIVILIGFLNQNLSAQSLTDFEKRHVLLPNGWSLTPAGKKILLGDLPLNY